MNPRRGFGIYVHWPFCQAKCPYCDFNSHVSGKVDQKVWAQAYQQELLRVERDMPGRVLDSVFFGGGTPSLMDPETVDLVLRQIRLLWPTSNTFEVTLEANPTSVEASRFQSYAEIGVNRVSIGVQALRDDDLRALGRLHSVDEALDAVSLAKRLFKHVSFDLIYARQNQSLADWHDELSEALALAADHLSLYQLTVEPGTVFANRFERGHLRGLPDENLSADMYELTQQLTAAAGMPAYEVSNHARPGSASRHNLIYWRSGDWLGVGPGAHGRFTSGTARIATETYLAPDEWLGATKAGNGESRRRTLSADEMVAERLMMGLRLSEGIAYDEYTNLSNQFNKLIDIGMLERRKESVATTPDGRLVLNAILRDLLI